MRLCRDYGPFDFRDACVRASWGVILPTTLVLALCIALIPLPGVLRKLLAVIRSPFCRFLELSEAEALLSDDVDDNKTNELKDDSAGVVSLWRTFLFAFVGLVESLAHLSLGAYRAVDGSADLWLTIMPFLDTFAWLYTVIRSILHPSITPPFDLLAFYVVRLLTGVLNLAGVFYDHQILDYPLPPLWNLSAAILNVILVGSALAFILSMSLALPSNRVKKEAIGLTVSPEDYTTVWGWISFSWVYPLVQRGRNRTLNEDDIWSLSPTMQSRAVFAKFSQIQRSTLLRKLWAANSLDIIMDFSLTVGSVMFNYAGPFFLKRILDSIESEIQTPETRARAYIYAFLAFTCSLGKAQMDVQHLWLGRRAATHIRSELMSAIYDKALKRKDFSGIVDKDKAREAQEKKDGAADLAKPKESATKGDDPKAGADVGKIVNLMASDANRIAQLISGMYFMYGAPFEIIIASVFLYQLLGWSAFAGFIVLVAGWPLNNFVARRSVRIQKGFLAAKDKRMGVLNELIGAIKFIKFFAWEDRWIERALDARAFEIKWMIKARINSVFFHLIWSCSPILVSIVSFFVYVALGNQLTVSKAFTAIALFGMIRAPLNVIPTWIIQLLQAGVALNRIATYLDEEEVTEQVSSLKKARSQPHDIDNDDGEGLGLAKASFKWNEVEERGKDSDGTAKAGDRAASESSEISSNDETETVVAQSDTASLTPSVTSIQDHRFELKDLSVVFPEGQLSLVTGPTASGKTALLMAILGEMTLIKGRIIMSKNTSKVDEHGLMHAISYAAQAPWLRHQSIKDNILFGYPYDEERYNEVIECCALKPDLAVLEDGDATEIGARGVSLSGGQKARVALARAVYARTKYVLLDDPLSAVDSHTARLLFDKLLRGPLLENRTVILVTHHVELVLSGAYYLVRMLDGRIDTQGTVKDLRAQGILEEIAHDEAIEVHKEEQQQAVTSDEATRAEVVAAEGERADSESATAAKKPRKLVQDEHREVGKVRWSIYNSYLQASSYWIWGFLATLLLISQLLSITEKVWIKIWGEAYGSPAALVMYRSFFAGENELQLDGQVPLGAHHHSSHISSTWMTWSYTWPSAIEHPMFYVGIYAAIGLGNSMTSISSVIAQYTGALRASRVLFRRLLITVVRATFRFHDTTPQGRLLNRFGKDIETLDLSLAGSLQSVNACMASLLASVLTVGFIFPLFLVPAFLVGLVYRELSIGYLNSGRDIRRMEANSRSPIFSDFGELLEGIVTVRAFSAEQRFLDNLHRKIDLTTKMWYGFWMTNRWLLLNFDVLGATIVLITTLFSLSSVDNRAGIAGLCITSAMTFTMNVYWACRMYTSLEMDLNAVERIVEYLDLPQEPPTIIESNRPPAYWPSSSSDNRNALIEVENLVIKYAPDLPPVLHDVSFKLKAKERVGLLGRTGSGKSTMAMSILRFVDPTSGRILIDGIDIAQIGLFDLRSRLTFIPQDATLFSGTLRENLDPFNEHEDHECLDVLQRVQMIGNTGSSSQTSRDHSRAPSIHNEDQELAPSVSSAFTETDAKTTISLDTQVSAGGTNFSQGQRQLIAMARALLRRSSIIILDEATSSIDFATDAKIQATIREEFNDSLLLTVAHRLRTVIDYDRLIILDQGKIAEFDTPLTLLRKKDGIFRNMCLKSGSFAELEAAAQAKANVVSASL
ncbi:hypothetical protein HGRIS_007200 [Hohenbuehelia grisea]|uniref:Multidrug resistance-associated ABC transporter n=1 Tax=Hohenbuehelia grisea TaxID=104357 RepID=A0ABR3JBH3_9AGAR